MRATICDPSYLLAIHAWHICRRQVASPSRAPKSSSRLDALASKTGRSKSYYAREAILRHIEDIEDYYLARRLGRGRARVRLESLERGLKKRTMR